MAFRSGADWTVIVRLPIERKTISLEVMVNNSAEEGSNIPAIAVEDWIEVSGIDGVVGHLYEETRRPLVGIVIFRPDKPTARDFVWNGHAFVFAPADGDFGLYASRIDKFSRHVAKLKSGK